jgi:adenylosuccinate lyase
VGFDKNAEIRSYGDMKERSIFLNLSPLDHRYYLSNKEIFDFLAQYLSEEAGIRYCLKAEIALLKAHVSQQTNLPDKDTLLHSLEGLEEKITPEEVYEEEEKTQHNIRSLVNVIKKNIPGEITHFVHLGATSMDILDTANSCRIRDAVRKVVLPLLCDVENKLIELTLENADTPQVGRTHGQHAVPVTFGFAMAEYTSRLGKSIQKIEEKSANLRGKLAGAVGAYNATSIVTSDPEQLEKVYLSSLGLEPSEYSTQIIESEYMLDLLLEMNTAFGIIANCADDLRNLQRSEIAEVSEEFTEHQVGSSTMPQKRNPWNCENIKSMWKAFCPRVLTFFMDQLSDHQRDLTNSASARFITDYIAGFTAAARRMLKVLSSLKVKKERMKENFSASADMVLAEPVYILLSLRGKGDAHEIVRKITLECNQNNQRLIEVLKKDPELWEIVTEKLKAVNIDDPDHFFNHPELYNGRAKEKAEMIAHTYQDAIKKIREKVENS